MNIGLRMKRRRKELKMSADELAKRLGKDRSTIYRYEKGDIENLPLDILEPIASALSTTPAYLMGWEEEIVKKPVEMGDRHFEMIMDEDLNDIYDDWPFLNKRERKMVVDFSHNLREIKTEA